MTHAEIYAQFLAAAMQHLTDASEGNWHYALDAYRLRRARREG